MVHSRILFNLKVALSINLLEKTVLKQELLGQTGIYRVNLLDQCFIFSTIFSIASCSTFWEISSIIIETLKSLWEDLYGNIWFLWLYWTEIRKIARHDFLCGDPFPYQVSVFQYFCLFPLDNIIYSAIFQYLVREQIGREERGLWV